MMIKETDIIVIGSGPAGYSAAIRAAQLGRKVCLVERAKAGGTCLNSGCIPTKFYWEAVHLCKKTKRSADYGFEASVKPIDYFSLRAKKDRNCDLLAKGLLRTLQSYGIEIIAGSASFNDKNTVTVSAAEGNTVIKAPSIVIATGSKPRNLTNLPIDHDRFIHSTDLLSLESLPDSLCIIGSGAIGVEFAFIFSSLGAKVRLLEKESNILPGEDLDAQNDIKKALEKNGIEVITSVEAPDTLIGDYKKVLISTGREPDLNSLGLDNAGIEYSAKGIKVNEYLATAQPHIYACGDATGRSYYAYTAQLEGAAAAENICGGKVKPEYNTLPRVVFSDPVYASVGKKFQELESNKYLIGKFPLTASSKSFIEGERAGMVKTAVEKSSGKIVSASILGSGAENLITIFALAIKKEMKHEELSRELFFHPSNAEALFMSLEDTAGKALELPKKDR